MRPKEFRLQEVVDYLQGSCNTLDSGLELIHPKEKEEGFSDDDLIESDYQFIANQIFLCDDCGWWCEIQEQSEEGSCEDCNLDA